MLPLRDGDEEVMDAHMPCARFRMSFHVTSNASVVLCPALVTLSLIKARRRRPMRGSIRYITPAPKLAPSAKPVNIEIPRFPFICSIVFMVVSLSLPRVECLPIANVVAFITLLRTAPLHATYIFTVDGKLLSIVTTGAGRILNERYAITGECMSKIAITHHEDVERGISDALNHLDLEPLIRGKLVAVKPNETWASADDTTGVTQPDTLRAVLRYVKQYGPRQLVVTGGSGAAETDEVFRVAGLKDVVEREEAIFVDHNRPPFTSVALDYGADVEVKGPQRSVMVNARVLEYETLIAVNQLKLHETATVTLALKNIAMSFPAADYYGHPRSQQRHRQHFFDDMHSFIAAMAKRFPVHVAVTVGHPAMIGTGPLGGHAVETGLTIASTDALAADVVGAKLLGFTAQAVRHLWEAGRLGLGETDLEQMEFPALNMRQAIETFTAAAYGERLTFEHE